MIDELEAHDIALIERATIRPSSRMTAITGETGSGKTALLMACRMVMGARADKTMVREGSEEASVSCRLFLGKGDVGGDHDVDGDHEVVVDRQLSVNGRSRVRIDGRMASVSELASIVGPTISLCSQHDQVALVRTDSQLSFLDSWGKVRESEAFAEYSRAFEEEGEARHDLERLQANLMAKDEQLEQARFVARQIGAVDPSAEDYEELLSSVRKAENAELLTRTTSEAHAALSGEGGALDQMNAAIALMQDASRADGSFAAYADSLSEALYAVEDVAREIGHLDDAFEFDAASIGLMQERISAYQSLIRSYGPDLEDVMARYEEALELIATHEDSDRLLQEALGRLASAKERTDSAARAMHLERERCARGFSDELNRVLSELGMGSSTLSCDVAMTERSHWNRTGPDAVSFMFTPVAGMSPRPLSKIASGGELSRVMLALHVVMGRRDEVSTLVFDEVDTGTGGETASALARVLARLAESHQVIVVTHSAQIAAAADRHYVVTKGDADGSVRTEIAESSGDDRVVEIARMLSGDRTEASLEHAKELLGS